MWRIRASTSRSSRVACTVPVRLSSRQRLSLIVPSMTQRRCGRESPGTVAAPGSSVSGLKRCAPLSRYSQVASDSSICASTSMRNMVPPTGPSKNYNGADFRSTKILTTRCPSRSRLLHRTKPVKERNPAGSYKAAHKYLDEWRYGSCDKLFLRRTHIFLIGQNGGWRITQADLQKPAHCGLSKLASLCTLSTDA